MGDQSHSVDTEAFKTECADAIFDLFIKSCICEFKDLESLKGKDIQYIRNELQEAINYFASVEQYEKAYFVKLVQDEIKG